MNSLSSPRRLDPRSERSRYALQQALTETLPTLPFEHITVVLLTQRAGVNRSTFYQHYSSTEDLLVDLVATRFNDCGVNAMDPSKLDFESDAPPEFIYRMAAYITTRRDRYWDCVPPSGRHSLLARFMAIMRDLLGRTYRYGVGGSMCENADLRIAGLAGAATGLLAEYLDNRGSYCVEEMSGWLWEIMRSTYYAKSPEEVVAKAVTAYPPPRD